MYYDANAGNFGTFYFDADNMPEIPTTTAAIICPCVYYTAVKPLDIDALCLISDLLEYDAVSVPEPEPVPEPTPKPAKVWYVIRYAMFVIAFMAFLFACCFASLTWLGISGVFGLAAYGIDVYIGKYDTNDVSFFY